MSLQLNGTDGVTFNDGSEQWAAASPIGTKNLIINGNMQIAQRGTSATGITTGTTYYTADRFSIQIGTAGTWTQSQSTDVPTGQGFATSVKWDCTTANGSLSAGSVLNILHRIEGQNLQHLKKGTSNAESVTLSFWVKSNKTGTYQVNLNDQDNSRLIGNTYTISIADTWEKKILTFAGDTTGAFNNDNNQSLQLEWWFVAGTDFSSGSLPTSWTSKLNADRAAGQTVNLADSTSNYINITGVQLEVGDTATPFEVMPYDMQLARCQRYYVESLICGGSGYATGSAQTASAQTTVVYPVTMRDTPSVSYTQDGAQGGNGTLASLGSDTKSGIFSEVSNVTNTRILWYGSITLSAEL